MSFFRLTFLLILGLATFSQADDLVIKPYETTVSISVSADKNIENKIKSYIGRELRSLGDVVITDENPDWILDIAAIEIKNKNNFLTGIALSEVILKPFRNKLIKHLVSSKAKKEVDIMTSDLYFFETHSLRLGTPDGLRDICNSIVADFDSNKLNPDRLFWQKIRDEANKSQKPSS